MAVAELKAARAQERLVIEQRRFAGEAQHSITSTLRLREAEERLALASRQVAAADQKQLYEVRRLAESRGVAGRGFLLFNRNVRQATGALDEHGRALSRSNSATEHSSRLRGRLGGALGFGVSNILGLGIGFGAASVAASSIRAATEDQASQASLQTQLKALGISYANNREEIHKTIAAQGAMSGFMDHELVQSFTTFVRRTGDVNQALKLNAVSMDIARARHMSLTQVAFLLNRAMNGNTRAATSLGLPLVAVTKNMDALRASGEKASHAQTAQAKAADKVATGQAVIAEAQKRFAGQAETYGKTAAGAQARLNRAFHETEVTVGTALLPTITRLAGHLAIYLNHLNRTGKLQHDVNTVMRTAGSVIHGVVGAFRLLAAIVRPVNRALGGTKHSVEVLALAFVGFKIVGLIGSFLTLSRAIRGVGTAAAVATPEVEALGAAEATAGGGGVAGAAAGVGLGLVGGAIAVGAAVVSSSGAAPNVPGIGSSGSAADRDRAQTISELATRGAIPRPVLVAAARAAGLDPNTPAGIVLRNKRVVAYLWAWAIKNGLIEAGPKNTSGMSNDPLHDAGGRPQAATPRRISRTSTSRGSGTSGVQLDDTGALVIPFDIRKALAINPEDEKALDRELAYIRRAIASKKLKGDNLLSAIDEARTIDEQLAAKATAARDKITALRQKHAREAAAAARRHTAELHREARVAERRRERSVTGRLLGFRAQLTRAEATPRNNDDLAVLDHEAAYLKSEIRNKHLALGFRQRLQGDLDAVNRKILAARKKTTKATSDFAALQRGAIATLNEIVKNESNFQQTNVNVHQYFPHAPTSDGFREAQRAHFAAQAAFA